MPKGLIKFLTGKGCRPVRCRRHENNLNKRINYKASKKHEQNPDYQKNLRFARQNLEFGRPAALLAAHGLSHITTPYSKKPPKERTKRPFGGLLTNP